MSVSLVQHDVILCNGNRWTPCEKRFEYPHAYARETRRAARREGWKVDVPNRWSRRRLDFCPEHANQA